MEVILKEDVAKLGSRGDVVKVAEGYGRNYLLPRKLAIQANAGNKAVIEQMKAASVRRSAKEKTQAEELAKQFEGVAVWFKRRAGEHDHLFVSETWGDIVDALAKKGFNLDRRKVQLHEPLKTVGEFAIPVKLHKDVTAHLKVVIEKEAAAEREFVLARAPCSGHFVLAPWDCPQNRAFLLPNWQATLCLHVLFPAKSLLGNHLEAARIPSTIYNSCSRFRS